MTGTPPWTPPIGRTTGSTRPRLSSTRLGDDLGTTRETVNANRITLAGAIKTRLAREAERTQVQGSYDATALWLQGLQGQLSNANAALEASTGQLGALQTCVAGATEALNQAAAGDRGRRPGLWCRDEIREGGSDGPAPA